MTRKLLLSLIALCAIFTISAQKWGAYTLIAPKTTTATLKDTLGTTYHSWSLTGTTAYSSYLLPDRILLRTISISPTNSYFTTGGVTGGLQEVDWDGKVLWSMTYSSSTYLLHHDISPLPNGNILAISYDLRTSADATAAGSSSAISIQSEKIIEIQPVGTSSYNIVWEWKLWDHLCQNNSSSKSNYVSSISANPQLMNINYLTQKDWMHMNGVDYNPYLDQITFSSHNFNEIYVIDHSTTTAEAATHTGGNSGKGGDFLYRWGNPAAYSASGTADFNIVHDAHWVTPECPYANYLVGFNNKGVSSSKVAIDMISPPYDGYNYYTTSGVYGPSSYTYRFTTSYTSLDEGNSQQLPNGNSIITVMTGNIYEVNASGTLLKSWSAGGTISKAFRYSKCYVDGTEPTTPTVTESNGILSSSVTGSSYQWYKNNYKIAGANSSTYTPDETAKYAVQIVESHDCLSSISDAITFVYSTAAVANTSYSQISMYPNPCKDVLNITGCEDFPESKLVIYNLTGKEISNQTATSTYNLNSLSNGVYIACIMVGNDIVLRQKLTVIK